MTNPPTGLLTVNTGSLKFARESARVLKPGGVAVHADYTNPTVNNENKKVYKDNFRFQVGKSWLNDLLQKISKYNQPYMDATVEMEPPFVAWASEAYGMRVVFDDKHEDMVMQVLKTTSPHDMYYNRTEMGHNFRVLILQKILNLVFIH